MERLNQAEAMLDRAGNRVIRARTLVSLGGVYSAHGYPDRAMETYRRALKVQEDIGDEQGMLESLNSRGTKRLASLIREINSCGFSRREDLVVSSPSTTLVVGDFA
jgi:tetratricopeptide (TPR) repeat protein